MNPRSIFTVILLATALSLSACGAGDDGQPLVYETIHEAASEGDLDDVHRHLYRGSAVNSRDEGRATPLHHAARHNRLEVARFLLDHGGAVEGRDDGRLTPLHVAAMRGHVPMVDLLIEHGAEVDVPGGGGATAAHLAARHGHEDVLDALVDAGADLSVEDGSGRSALDVLRVHRGELAVVWEWSDRLPTTFGRAQLSGRGNEYDNGAFLRASHQRADRGDRHLDRVAVPAGYRSVRVILSPEDVDAMAAVEADSDAGAEPNHYWLEYEREDGERRKAAPVGYIYRDEDNEFSFAVRATLEGFNDIDDVPLIRTRRGVRPRGEGEDFYLYFPVPEGATPTAIGVRDQTAQELGEPDDND